MCRRAEQALGERMIANAEVINPPRLHTPLKSGSISLTVSV